MERGTCGCARLVVVWGSGAGSGEAAINLTDDGVEGGSDVESIGTTVKAAGITVGTTVGMVVGFDVGIDGGAVLGVDVESAVGSNVGAVLGTAQDAARWVLGGAVLGKNIGNDVGGNVGITLGTVVSGSRMTTKTPVGVESLFLVNGLGCGAPDGEDLIFSRKMSV